MAAVTVPVLALRGEEKEPLPALGVTASVPVSLEMPLGFGPSWVPSGFRERIRQSDVSEPGDPFGPTVTRVWKKQARTGDPWGGAEIALYVRTGVPDPAQAIGTSGQRVDINGATGHLAASEGDGKSSVDWVAGPHTVLMIATSHVEVSKADLLRMARSVRAASGTATVPVVLRGLPEGWSSRSATVSGPSAGTWRAQVSAVREEKVVAKTKGDGGSLSVTVGVGTEAPAGGEKLTVGGHPARHPVRSDAAGRSLTYLVVDLGHNRLMTVIGDGLALGELTTIAEQTEIAPAGLDWLDR